MLSYNLSKKKKKATTKPDKLKGRRASQTQTERNRRDGLNIKIPNYKWVMLSSHIPGLSFLGKGQSLPSVSLSTFAVPESPPFPDLSQHTLGGRAREHQPLIVICFLKYHMDVL